MKPVPIFISYAQEDQMASEAIQRQLVIMRRKKRIVFNDQHKLKFDTTERWESIKNALNQSPVILLILSDFFIASDECYEVQEFSLNRSQAGQSVLIPVLCKKCAWQDLDGVSRLQPLPRNRVFIKDWPDSDSAYAEIAKEVGTLAQQIFDGKITLNDQAQAAEEVVVPNEQEMQPEITDPRQLIAQGQVGKALEVLAQKTKNDVDLNNEVTALQAQFANLNGKIRQGTISTANERLERNQIIAAILSIINDL